MKELPAICNFGEHDYRTPSSSVTPTCGATNGADIYQEVMVVTEKPPRGYQPQIGDICNRCFHIYGTIITRDSHLTKIFTDLASWE